MDGPVTEGRVYSAIDEPCFRPSPPDKANQPVLLREVHALHNSGSGQILNAAQSHAGLTPELLNDRVACLESCRGSEPELVKLLGYRLENLGVGFDDLVKPRPWKPVAPVFTLLLVITLWPRPHSKMRSTRGRKLRDQPVLARTNLRAWRASVPGVGFEPTWSRGPKGFKPFASNRLRHPGRAATLPVARGQNPGRSRSRAGGSGKVIEVRGIDVGVVVTIGSGSGSGSGSGAGSGSGSG